MKNLVAMMLVAFLSIGSAHAVNLTVDRITKPYVHIIEGDTKSFSFIRELCTDTGVYVKVYKKFKNRSTGKFYYSPYPSEYDFKAGDCNVSIYTVPLDIQLPEGSYDYLPTAQLKTYEEDGKPVIRKSVDLPKEVFVIKPYSN